MIFESQSESIEKIFEGRGNSIKRYFVSETTSHSLLQKSHLLEICSTLSRILKREMRMEERHRQSRFLERRLGMNGPHQL